MSDFDERVQNLKSEIDRIKALNTEVDEKWMDHLFSQIVSLTDEFHTMVDAEIASLPAKKEVKSKTKKLS
jgi:uncharacterized small protein (DUF1192 family)